ncbi:MAG: hypothetical protein V5A46_00095 [Haloferacaceae archaeon]
MSTREGFQELWDAVSDDAEETAAEYEAEGWETQRLHVGDVTPLPAADAGSEDPDRIGLDVLVPGDEFEELERFVDGATFDEYDVYRGGPDGLTLLLLVVRATERRRVVLVPMYYEVSDATAMRSAAEAAGACHTYVRPLSDDRRVVFSHEDPSLFFPPEDEE